MDRVLLLARVIFVFCSKVASLGATCVLDGPIVDEQEQ
jgi:hypothetical protein